MPWLRFESPLWPSTQRGAKVSQAAGGIRATLVNDTMTRSILLEAIDAPRAVAVIKELEQRTTELAEIVRTTSRYACFAGMHSQIVGPLMLIVSP